MNAMHFLARVEALCRSTFCSIALLLLVSTLVFAAGHTPRDPAPRDESSRRKPTPFQRNLILVPLKYVLPTIAP